MIKPVLTYAGIFLGVFIIALLALFPYSSVANAVLTRQIQTNKLPATYTNLDSGLFRTKITGVTFNNVTTPGGRVIDTLNLGDISVSYTPLSALTYGVKAVINSGYGTANLKYNKNNLNIDAVLNFSRIANTMNFQAAGDLNVIAKYSNKDHKGTFNLSSGAFTVFIPGFGPVKGESLTAEGTISANIIIISSLKTTGENMTLEDAKGQIQLDTVNIQRSVINIVGRAQYAGLAGNFGIKGTLGAPQFNLQAPKSE